jgi:peptidylprolyl isomerase
MQKKFALVLLAALTAFAAPAAFAAKAKPATKQTAKSKTTKPAPAAAEAKPVKNGADILKNSPASDWRGLDPNNVLLMNLPSGQVVIELAPRFAPQLIANIRALAQGGYWDGLSILRVQENYVTQWGDPEEDDAKAKPLPAGAKAKIDEPFNAPLKGLPLSKLPDVDGWAPLTGFVDGFPVAANPKTGRAWVAHCYATVGVARGNEKDSGNGSGLYMAIGQAPRSLENNIAAVGRVIKGMELLSSLPRGTGPLGFYEKPEQRVTIQSIKLAADVPEADRPKLQVLRTDSQTWTDLLDARRRRVTEGTSWYVHNPDHTDICSGTVPTRPLP